MIERLHLSAILLIAALVWGVLLYYEGVPVSGSWLRPIGAVTTALAAVLALFELFLWQIPWLYPWFVGRPRISGTWRVEIRSDWIDPSTGTATAPIQGYMAIAQTFSRLSLRLMTRESQSEILGAEIVQSGDGSYRVVGVYRNEPRMSVRHRSEIHNGGLVLQAAGSPPVSLAGQYWTDRKTAGELALSDRRAKVMHDISSAEALFAKSS